MQYCKTCDKTYSEYTSHDLKHEIYDLEKLRVKQVPQRELLSLVKSSKKIDLFLQLLLYSNIQHFQMRDFIKTNTKYQSFFQKEQKRIDEFGLAHVLILNKDIGFIGEIITDYIEYLSHYPPNISQILLS